MNVLVIAPHPDDEAIGCGGTILLHVARGDIVEVAFLTSGELGLKHLPEREAWAIREEEARAAARVLGTVEPVFLRCPDWFVGEQVASAASAVSGVMERRPPALIYVPHRAEWHPDHRAAAEVARLAVNAAPERVEIRTYEVWTPLSEYSHVEDITHVFRRKIEAVRCYRSQLPDFRYDRAVRGLNGYRGALAGRVRFAEVFGELTLDAEEGEASTSLAPDRNRY